MKKITTSRILFLSGLVLWPLCQAFGQTWVGGIGLWSDSNNWDKNTVPSGTTHVYINNGGTAEIKAGEHVVVNASGSYGTMLGSTTGGAATLKVGGSLTTQSLSLGTGADSRGFLYIDDGGVVTVQAGASVGGRAGSYAKLEVGAGSFSVVGNFNIGQGGEGVLMLNNGARAEAGASVYLGGDSTSTTFQGGNGSAILKGDATWNIASILSMGYKGTGNLEIGDDAFVSALKISAGRQQNGYASNIILKGGGSLKFTDENSNTDVYKMNVEISGSGSWESSHSSLSIKSSSVTVSDQGTWKNSGTFILTDSSSLVLADDSNVYVGGLEINSGSVLRILGDNVNVSNANGSSASRIEGKTGTGTISFEQSGALNFSNEISGSLLKVEHSGKGTTTLTSSNTYGAGTFLKNGMMIAANSTAFGTGAVNIEGGSLTMSVGSLSVSGIFLSNGRLALSDGKADTISVVETFSMTGGTYEIDILDLDNFDQILSVSGSGNLILEGGVLLLSGYNGFEGIIENGEGFSYHLFDGFKTLDSHGLTISGYDSVNWVADINQEGYLVFSANTIPEPSVAFLIAMVLGCCVFVRRRSFYR